MPVFKIVLGVCAMVLAWALVFRTGLIFRVNAWMRESVFTDQLILFNGRRLALLLLVLGGVAIFSGIESVSRGRTIKPRIASKILVRSEQDYRQGHYDQVIRQCQALIRSDPKNLVAMELMASAYWALGQKEQTRQLIRQILHTNPNYPIARGPLRRAFRQKGSQTNF